MPKRIGVAGTPGSGKKTVARVLAARLGYDPLDINSLAASRRRRGSETLEVEYKTLRDRLQKVGSDKRVVHGHLLPFLFKKSELDYVAVLRCEPAVLKRRLVARVYPPEKLRANLEAELIGVVLDECVRRFGPDRVFEYDTSQESPENTAERILSDLVPTARGRKRRWIDWTLSYASPRRLTSLFATESTESALT